MRLFHKIALLSAAVASSAVFATADDAEAPNGKVAEEPAKDAATDPGFARYQTILDRQPFGPPPPGFDPSLPVGQQAGGGAANADGGKTEAEISAEEQKMMSSVRVSVLNVTPSGAVMVGFTDSTTQPPVNYYLKVGETSTDSAKWLVKDANPSEGSVSLSKDGIDITLSVGGETKKGAPMAGKPAAPGMAGMRPTAPMPIRSRNPPGGIGEKPSADEAPGGALARLRERRMQRQADEAARRQAAETARVEREARQAQERAEHEAKLEAEREQQRVEREQQRQALLQIQEELRRQREAKEAREAEEKNNQPPPQDE